MAEMSLPDSPAAYSHSESGSLEWSEGHTEPLPVHERMMISEYMSRRQNFLSDYERYNPVQNMHMLANHVFELREGIDRLKNDFVASRRQLDIVKNNQLDHNASLRELGGEFRSMGDNVAMMTSDIHTLGGAVVGLTKNVSTVVTEISPDRTKAMNDEIASIKQDMISFRQETQSGLDELKNMMSTITQVVMKMRS